MNEFQVLLKSIQDGQTHFSPESDKPIDMDAFQHIAKMLVHAEEIGLIDGLKIHRESSTGHRWYVRAFLTGGLSYKGTLYANMEPEKKEIFELKPTFHGVSVDIKEAIRRLIHKWKGGDV